jgi:apolipoprotein N-acyltransferase
LLLAVLSGLLANAAFPPFGIWPLIVVAFVPMIVAQHRVMPPRWSGLAVGVGVGTYCCGQFTPGLSFAGQHVAIVFQLLPLYVVVLVTALAWRSRAFQERTAYRWFLVSAPVAWVGIDALRSLGNEALGGTFANPAYALFEHPLLLQPISVFGIWGLELLVLIVNWAAAAAVIAAIDHRVPREPTAARMSWKLVRRAAGVTVALVVVWCVTSAALLRDPEPTVRVAAVQTGLGTRTAAQRAERFRRDIAQTRAAARAGARLVVWNEAGLRFDPKTTHTAELRSLAKQTDAYLAIGYFVKTSRGRRNEVTVLAPDGRFLGVYGKEHPGTFAGDYSDTGGTSFPVYHTDFGTIASIICYDLDFTDTARKVTRHGARLIAASSSDVTTLADTHYTHLVFRAIENRVSTVKADNRYDSAIIDPYGRLLAVTTNPDGAQRTLVADVPLGSGDSPYVTLGDWFGQLCALAMVGFLVLAWRIRRRDRKDSAAAEPADAAQR